MVEAARSAARDHWRGSTILHIPRYGRSKPTWTQHPYYPNLWLCIAIVLLVLSSSFLNFWVSMPYVLRCSHVREWLWRYQDHVLNEISEVVEATSKQHDNTQVDIAAAQRAKRKNVHIVFAKTYFSQGAFRFTAKSGFRGPPCFLGHPVWVTFLVWDQKMKDF